MRDNKTSVIEYLTQYAYQVRNPPFRLKNGEMSSHYVDCRPLMLEPTVRRMAADLIAGHADWTYPGIGFVAGVVLGGCTLAVEIGQVLNLPVLFVRTQAKEHGTENQIIAPPLITPKSAPGILIDDVVTSGGSMGEAIEVLSSQWFNLHAAYALVDRSGENSIGGVPLVPLCHIDELAARYQKRLYENPKQI